MLACLPSVPHAAVRPLRSRQYAGEVLGVLSTVLIVLGLAWLQWGKQYMLGFLPLFAGFGLLGMAKGVFPQKTTKPQEIWLEPCPDLSAQAKRPLWQWIVVHA